MNTHPHVVTETKTTLHKTVKWGTFGTILLLIGFILSIGLGAVWIEPSVLFQSFLSFDNENIHHQLIYEVRFPRAIASALIGAALAISGAVMQGLTRNPLADPSIIGITHGAGLAIAISLAFIGSGSYITLLIWSFAGAALGAFCVLAFSVVSRDRMSPVTLTLAGAALSTLFSALSTGIALYFQVAQDLSFWFAGGLSGTKWLHVWILLPTVTIGILLSLWIGRSLTILAMGEEVATGLGQAHQKTRLIGISIVILLCGAAVSIAGAIGFIGLIVPHIVRLLLGPDYRIVVPLSAVAGAVLLVFADVGARVINPPFETPVSALTALIGVPFFLYLARQKRGYM